MIWALTLVAIMATSNAHADMFLYNMYEKQIAREEAAKIKRNNKREKRKRWKAKIERESLKRSCYYDKELRDTYFNGDCNDH